MRKLGFIVWITVCWVVQHANAQDSSRWTLEECIAYAKQHNISINTLRLTRASSNEDVLQARAARIPSLAGSASQSFTNSKNADPVIGGFQTQSSWAGNYGVNTSVTLFNAGYLQNSYKEKKLLLQSADLNILQTENDITLQLTQAFLQALLTRENIVYLQDVLETSNAQLTQAKQRYDAGSIAKKDYLTFEAQVAADEYNLVAAKNTYRNNLLTIQQLLQIPMESDFDILVEDKVEIPVDAPPLDTAINVAMRTRPEVQNSQLAIEIAKIQIRMARAGHYPTVSLGGTLSTGYTDNTTEAYFNQLNNNFYQRASLTVGIPIFSNRTVRTAENKAKINLSQSNLNLLNTRTLLTQAIEQAYIGLLNAESQYSAAQKQVTSTEEAYRIVQAQLRLGGANLVELLQQKNLYIQSMQAFLQAKYANILQRKIYDYYMGIAVTL
ncbi:outer membrane protein [Chitinophaga skermanii]|uniref:Outer membrane protein n=1 Tax=Chitinophaga skermanii TaxID=331697 RepID=A0A327QS20_9BACT|nr:TolC family protein [Chitinophaga skermanii]RAJ06492.1 outer membrane protein [Chitinophaga skermanii]